MTMRLATSYKTRFIRDDQAVELINLFHLSKVPLAGKRPSRYDRMLWTAKEFHKAHPEVSEAGAYKDLDGLIAQ